MRQGKDGRVDAKQTWGLSRASRVNRSRASLAQCQGFLRPATPASRRVLEFSKRNALSFGKSVRVRDDGLVA